MSRVRRHAGAPRQSPDAHAGVPAEDLGGNGSDAARASSGAGEAAADGCSPRETPSDACRTGSRCESERETGTSHGHSRVEGSRGPGHTINMGGGWIRQIAGLGTSAADEWCAGRLPDDDNRERKQVGGLRNEAGGGSSHFPTVSGPVEASSALPTKTKAPWGPGSPMRADLGLAPVNLPRQPGTGMGATSDGAGRSARLPPTGSGLCAAASHAP